jgi:hypothetical protein
MTDDPIRDDDAVLRYVREQISEFCSKSPRYCSDDVDALTRIIADGLPRPCQILKGSVRYDQETRTVTATLLISDPDLIEVITSGAAPSRSSLGYDEG